MHLAACRTFVLDSLITVCMSVNKHNIVYSSCVVTVTTVESLTFEAALKGYYDQKIHFLSLLPSDFKSVFG